MGAAKMVLREGGGSGGGDRGEGAVPMQLLQRDPDPGVRRRTGAHIWWGRATYH
jgi:hypothetical protein